MFFLKRDTISNFVYQSKRDATQTKSDPDSGGCAFCNYTKYGLIRTSRAVFTSRIRRYRSLFYILWFLSKRVKTILRFNDRATSCCSAYSRLIREGEKFGSPILDNLLHIPPHLVRINITHVPGVVCLSIPLIHLFVICIKRPHESPT